MSFDLDKLQAVAELGEVIRLQNEALDKLVAFRKTKPHLMMPNLAKMVEENIKENVQVLYKELNNLHKPATEQVRYICKECNMAFLVRLPGGICDECRARATGTGQPRAYVVNTETPAEEDIQIESDNIKTDAGQSGEKSLADVAAEAVADDLTVADEMPRESEIEDDLGIEPEHHPADDNVYELSMEDDAQPFAFDDDSDDDDDVEAKTDADYDTKDGDAKA